MVIGKRQISEIKELAQRTFNSDPGLGRFDAKELQIYLILQGLNQFLTKNKIQPGFEVEGFIQEDCLPIDESGLGDFE